MDEVIDCSRATQHIWAHHRILPEWVHEACNDIDRVILDPDPSSHIRQMSGAWVHKTLGTVPDMPTVTVITAAGPAAGEFLGEAGDSVRAATEPAWDLCWYVVADDDDPGQVATIAQAARDAGADRVWSNASRLWAGASRNRALAHVTTDFVVCLDADDLLTRQAPGAWAAAHAASPGTWSAFEVIDLHSDGTHSHHAQAWPDGPVARRAWADHYAATGHHPAHPISVLWPTDLLIGLGGWAAAPAGADASPILAASAAGPGYHLNVATHLYRRHPGQTTSQATRDAIGPAWQDALRLATRRADILSR